MAMASSISMLGASSLITLIPRPRFQRSPHVAYAVTLLWRSGPGGVRPSEPPVLQIAFSPNRVTGSLHFTKHLTNTATVNIVPGRSIPPLARGWQQHVAQRVTEPLLVA